MNEELKRLIALIEESHRLLFGGRVTGKVCMLRGLSAQAVETIKIIKEKETDEQL